MAENKIRKVIDGFTKVQMKSFVQAMLRTDLEWAKRAVLRVYELQAPSEQRAHYSRLRNMSGFTVYDAPILSQLACKLRANKPLTGVEERKLLYRMPKYAVQLINASDYEKLEKALHSYYS